jgi:pyruvate formate lyase activating enzyme
MLLGDDNMKAKVHSIETFGCDDGWGIRYIVFLANCSMKCSYCANIDCACGKFEFEMSPQDVIDNMNQYRDFYLPNKGGLTLCGGEPLLHIDWCIETARLAKENGYTVTIDTCGYMRLEDMSKLQELLKYVDLVLMDYKAFNNDRHVHLTLRSNYRIKEAMQIMSDSGTEMWIRHVLINGTNTDSNGDIDFVYICKDIAENLKTVTRFDLLPFHNMGEDKWHELGLEYKHSDDSVPTVKQMDYRLHLAESVFRDYGRDIEVIY